MIVTDKGKQVMEGLLLNQYQNSPNLQEYLMAFISELDFLFETTQRVYEERFLDKAVGAQLDVIGIILQQPRTVILPELWFGFQGGLNVDKMANESAPAIGGMFKDEATGYGDITPLSDVHYRRLLMAKASIMNSTTIDINTAYHVISLLLERVPSNFKIEDLGSRSIQLTISTTNVSDTEVSLILYATKYFVPAGITFTINKV